MTDDVAPKRAAGVLFRDPSGAVLLCRRADGEGWAYPGGGIEGDETPEAAARREAREETGVDFSGELKPWSRRVKDGVDFTTFLAQVPDRFEPELDAEHTEASWLRPDEALAPDAGLELHPGAAASLKLFGANELDVARLIRDGDLVSPQRFGNFLIIALRVTGTGLAYRPAIDEFVWREPSLYLNPDFLERCQGLPVLERHPKGMLDSAAFAKLAVGTAMLPYIRGDEVWCVAKVYDAKTIEAIEAEQLSTSPGVTATGAKIKLKGGKHVLVEDDPKLLDHVAICEDGVWDKGGPPTGVDVTDARNDSTTNTPTGEDDMAENGERRDAARKDSTEGGAPVEGERREGGEEMTDSKKLDAILEHVGKLHARHDAFEERLGKLEGKKEGGEAPGEPVAADRRDGKELSGSEPGEGKGGGEGAEKAEREENGLEAKDARRDGAGCGAMDSRHHNDAASAALRQELASVRAELATVRASIPKELPPEEHSKFISAQARAERVAQAYGDAAPKWLQGEGLASYRRRLARPFQQYSKAWKEIDLGSLPDQALDVAEAQIYADAWSEATRPTPASAGRTLRKVTDVDGDTGRRITRFFGDPHVWLDQFSNPTRCLTRININRRN